MPTETRNKIPAPLYAAAGAGDLAYQRLRKLPARVAELRSRVASADRDAVVDVDRLRAAARRNAAAFVAGAQQASHRVAIVYTDLVTRGEQVVAAGRANRMRTPADPAPAQLPEAAVVSEAETTRTGEKMIEPGDPAEDTPQAK